MQRLSGGSIAITVAFLIIAILGLMVFRIEYQVPRPEGWPESVNLYKQPVTENIRVVDGATGRTLFWYQGSAGRDPVRIEKLASGEWLVVFDQRE